LLGGGGAKLKVVSVRKVLKDMQFSTNIWNQAHKVANQVTLEYTKSKEADCWLKTRSDSDFEAATMGICESINGFTVTKKKTPYSYTAAGWGVVWGVRERTTVSGHGLWYVYDSLSGYDSVGPCSPEGIMLQGVTWSEANEYNYFVDDRAWARPLVS
jgi:hypothetical protein